MQEKNSLSQTLRIMADVVDEFGLTAATISYDGNTLTVYEYTEEEYAKRVSQVNRSALTENGEKEADDWYSNVTFPLTGNPGLAITVQTTRTNVCRKVQTGTKMVEKTDPNAPKVMVEEAVYEWKCKPSILANASTENGESDAV